MDTSVGCNGISVDQVACDDNGVDASGTGGVTSGVYTELTRQMPSLASTFVREALGRTAGSFRCPTTSSHSRLCSGFMSS
jgi:hypothetical protein